MRQGVARLGVGSLWTMARLLPAIRRRSGRPLRPRLTRRNLRKRRHRRQGHMAETPGPPWESGGQAGSPLPPGLSLLRSASRRQRRVASTSLLTALGTSHTVYPMGGDATRPAYGREDGGSVGAQRLAVRARTWGRSVRGSLSKGKPTEAERKAEAGPQRLVHLAVGNDASALPESTGPTGKRRARKRACSVWSGGKAAKPYLSLPIYVAVRPSAAPMRVSSFRLLTLSCRYGMLFGSDCNNNMLWNVTGIKRGDTVGLRNLLFCQ